MKVLLRVCFCESALEKCFWQMLLASDFDKEGWKKKVGKRNLEKEIWNRDFGGSDLEM